MMSTTWSAIKTDRAVLIALICFRLLNGFLLQSTFHPDEEWQSSEVAHSLAFGFGFLTWEWEKCIALRSVAHPAIFAVMFWILKQLRLDFPDVIAVAPRLLQSFIAAMTDYGVIQLAKEWYGGAVTADSAGQDLTGMTVLLSRKRDNIMKTQNGSRGHGLRVAGDACDPKSVAETSPNSTERNKECSLRTVAEAGHYRSRSVTGTILHCLARVYHADGLADFTKGANVVHWITLCFLLSWFNFFCLPRTYSNCVEAFLNVYALWFFALAQRRENRKVGRSVNARIGAAVKSHEARGTDAARVPTIERPTSDSWKAFSAEEIQEELCHDGRVREGGGYGKALTERYVVSLPRLSSLQQLHLPTFYTFLALNCAALSVIMRPPAAIFWTVFCLCKIVQHFERRGPRSTLEDKVAKERVGEIAVFLGLCFIVGAVAVGCNLYLDFLFYGKLTFPPLNFVKFNMLMDPGRFFGAYPWHYYLLECPLVVLLTFYPFFVLGVKFWLETLYRRAATCYARRVQRTGEKGTPSLEIAKYLIFFIVSRDDGAALQGTVLSLLLLSFSTHKEYRFMISYMPVLLTYVGIGVAGFVSGKAQLLTALDGERDSSDVVQTRRVKEKGFLTRLALKYRARILCVVFGAQVLFAVYFGFFHRRGTPPVMRFLRHLPEGSSVFFLSPTHELPYYSQLHRNFPMGFLDASPRLRRELDFPADWQTRFWASGKKSDYLNFLDSFFISPSNPQQIPASPSAQSHVSWASTAPSRSSRVSTCPATSPFRSLSSFFSPTSDVRTCAHPAVESSADSLSSSGPPPASLTRELGKRQLGNVSAPASASPARMRSDIYSQVPHESECLSFSFADLVFGGVRGTKNEKETINVASRTSEAEKQQNVSFSSGVGSANGRANPITSTAVDNFWFGDAAQFRRRLCRVGHWPHSKNCEVSPTFEECLDYRFLVPLYGQLPTHFVLTSYIYEKIPEWFRSRGYIVKFGPIFDSIVGESPHGKVFWQYLYVLERRTPASSVVFA